MDSSRKKRRVELVCLGLKTGQSARSHRSVGLQLFVKWASGVTLDGLQALYGFHLEVCLEVRDRSANQPAGSLGDPEQPCLVLLFEAGEVTEAVECHHQRVSTK